MRRLSVSFRTVGSIQSGGFSSVPSSESSSGRDARSGGFSAGHAPRGLTWERAIRRSRSADPDGARQMGALAPAEAVSLSSARNVREGDPAASLRACLSLISSGMSMRTALGRNLSRSRHRRLEKAVRSAVSPCLTTATVLPSGSIMAASMGMARYQRKRNGNATLEMAEARR